MFQFCLGFHQQRSTILLHSQPIKLTILVADVSKIGNQQCQEWSSQLIHALIHYHSIVFTIHTHIFYHVYDLKFLFMITIS